MSSYKPGTPVPTSGIYWCSVCKLPIKLAAGQDFPSCENLCGRGVWQLVEPAEAPREESDNPATPPSP